jgi:hypothetical protein
MVMLLLYVLQNRWSWRRDSVEAVGEAVVGEDPAVLGEAVVREVDAEERVHTA